jgi:PadR family transcriptional regulator PadR
VSGVLTAQAAILQALWNPGYGLQIADRIRRSTAGRVRVRLGSLYPALRDLQRRGLVRSWEIAGARGRPRTYYELTRKGIAVAAADREGLRRLTASSVNPPSTETLARMSERLRRCASVSRFVLQLQRGMREATSRQGR